MKTTKTIRTRAESLQQAAYNVASSPDAPATQLRAVVLRLHACARGGRKSKIREQYESTAAKLCLAKCGELPPGEEENPLDDYEKLRAVRIAVFGSAPESDP